MDEGGIDSVSLQTAFSDLHFPNILVSEEPEFSDVQLFSPDIIAVPPVDDYWVQTTIQSTSQSPQLFITEHGSIEDRLPNEENRVSRRSAHLVQQKLLLPAENDAAKRIRSPSPMWVPGETSTFAEVVRSGSVSRNTSRRTSPEKLQEVTLVEERPFIDQMVVETKTDKSKKSKVPVRGNNTNIEQAQSCDEETLVPVKQKTSKINFVTKPLAKIRTEYEKAHRSKIPGCVAAKTANEPEQFLSNSSKKKSENVSPQVNQPEKSNTIEECDSTTEVVPQLSKIDSRALLSFVGEKKKPSEPKSRTTFSKKDEPGRKEEPSKKLTENKSVIIPADATVHKKHESINKKIKSKPAVSTSTDDIDGSKVKPNERKTKMILFSTPTERKVSEKGKLSEPKTKTKSVNAPALTIDNEQERSYVPKMKTKSTSSPTNINNKLIGGESSKIDAFANPDALIVISDQVIESSDQKIRKTVSQDPSRLESLHRESTVTPEYEEYYEDGKLLRQAVVIGKKIAQTHKIVMTSTADEVSLGEEPIVTLVEENTEEPTSDISQTDMQIIQLSTESNDLEVAKQIETSILKTVTPSLEEKIIEDEKDNKKTDSHKPKAPKSKQLFFPPESESQQKSIEINSMKKAGGKTEKSPSGTSMMTDIITKGLKKIKPRKQKSYSPQNVTAEDSTSKISFSPDIDVTDVAVVSNSKIIDVQLNSTTASSQRKIDPVSTLVELPVQSVQIFEVADNYRLSTPDGSIKNDTSLNKIASKVKSSQKNEKHGTVVTGNVDVSFSTSVPIVELLEPEKEIIRKEQSTQSVPLKKNELFQERKTDLPGTSSSVDSIMVRSDPVIKEMTSAIKSDPVHENVIIRTTQVALDTHLQDCSISQTSKILSAPTLTKKSKKIIKKQKVVAPHPSYSELEVPEPRFNSDVIDKASVPCGIIESVTEIKSPDSTGATKKYSKGTTSDFSMPENLIIPSETISSSLSLKHGHQLTENQKKMASKTKPVVLESEDQTTNARIDLERKITDVVSIVSQELPDVTQFQSSHSTVAEEKLSPIAESDSVGVINIPSNKVRNTNDLVTALTQEVPESVSQFTTDNIRVLMKRQSKEVEFYDSTDKEMTPQTIMEETQSIVTTLDTREVKQELVHSRPSLLAPISSRNCDESAKIHESKTEPISHKNVSKPIGKDPVSHKTKSGKKSKSKKQTVHSDINIKAVASTSSESFKEPLAPPIIPDKSFIDDFLQNERLHDLESLHVLHAGLTSNFNRSKAKTTDESLYDELSWSNSVEPSLIKESEVHLSGEESLSQAYKSNKNQKLNKKSEKSTGFVGKMYQKIKSVSGKRKELNDCSHSPSPTRATPTFKETATFVDASPEHVIPFTFETDHLSAVPGEETIIEAASQSCATEKFQVQEELIPKSEPKRKLKSKKSQSSPSFSIELDSGKTDASLQDGPIMSPQFTPSPPKLTSRVLVCNLKNKKPNVDEHSKEIQHKKITAIEADNSSQVDTLQDISQITKSLKNDANLAKNVSSMSLKPVTVTTTLRELDGNIGLTKLEQPFHKTMETSSIDEDSFKKQVDPKSIGTAVVLSNTDQKFDISEGYSVSFERPLSTANIVEKDQSMNDSEITAIVKTCSKFARNKSIPSLKDILENQQAAEVLDTVKEKSHKKQKTKGSNKSPSPLIALDRSINAGSVDEPTTLVLVNVIPKSVESSAYVIHPNVSTCADRTLPKINKKQSLEVTKNITDSTASVTELYYDTPFKNDSPISSIEPETTDNTILKLSEDTSTKKQKSKKPLKKITCGNVIVSNKKNELCDTVSISTELKSDKETVLHEGTCDHLREISSEPHIAEISQPKQVKSGDWLGELGKKQKCNKSDSISALQIENSIPGEIPDKLSIDEFLNNERQLTFEPNDSNMPDVTIHIGLESDSGTNQLSSNEFEAEKCTPAKPASQTLQLIKQESSQSSFSSDNESVHLPDEKIKSKSKKSRSNEKLKSKKSDHPTTSIVGKIYQKIKSVSGKIKEYPNTSSLITDESSSVVKLDSNFDNFPTNEASFAGITSEMITDENIGESDGVRIGSSADKYDYSSNELSLETVPYKDIQNKNDFDESVSVKYEEIHPVEFSNNLESDRRFDINLISRKVIKKTVTIIKKNTSPDQELETFVQLHEPDPIDKKSSGESEENLSKNIGFQESGLPKDKNQPKKSKWNKKQKAICPNINFYQVTDIIDQKPAANIAELLQPTESNLPPVSTVGSVPVSLDQFELEFVEEKTEKCNQYHHDIEQDGKSAVLKSSVGCSETDLSVPVIDARNLDENIDKPSIEAIKPLENKSNQSLSAPCDQHQYLELDVNVKKNKNQKPKKPKDGLKENTQIVSSSDFVKMEFIENCPDFLASSEISEINAKSLKEFSFSSQATQINSTDDVRTETTYIANKASQVKESDLPLSRAANPISVEVDVKTNKKKKKYDRSPIIDPTISEDTKVSHLKTSTSVLNISQKIKTDLLPAIIDTPIGFEGDTKSKIEKPGKSKAIETTLDQSEEPLIINKNMGAVKIPSKKGSELVVVKAVTLPKISSHIEEDDVPLKMTVSPANIKEDKSKKKRKHEKSKFNQKASVQWEEPLTGDTDDQHSKVTTIIALERSKPGQNMKTTTTTIIKPSQAIKGDSDSTTITKEDTDKKQSVKSNTKSAFDQSNKPLSDNQNVEVIFTSPEERNQPTLTKLEVASPTDDLIQIIRNDPVCIKRDYKSMKMKLESKIIQPKDSLPDAHNFEVTTSNWTEMREPQMKTKINENKKYEIMGNDFPSVSMANPICSMRDPEIKAPAEEPPFVDPGKPSSDKNHEVIIKTLERGEPDDAEKIVRTTITKSSLIPKGFVDTMEKCGIKKEKKSEIPEVLEQIFSQPVESQINNQNEEVSIKSVEIDGITTTVTRSASINISRGIIEEKKKNLEKSKSIEPAYIQPVEALMGDEYQDAVLTFMESDEPRHVIKTVTKKMTKSSPILESDPIPLMSDIPLYFERDSETEKEKKFDESEGIELVSGQPVQSLMDDENQVTITAVNSGEPYHTKKIISSVENDEPGHFIKTIITVSKPSQIVKSDSIPLMTTAPIDAKESIIIEKKKKHEKLKGIESGSIHILEPPNDHKNQEVSITPMKIGEPGHIINTETTTIIKSSQIGSGGSLPLMITASIDSLPDRRKEKNQKPEKSKGTEPGPIQAVQPLIDGENQKLTVTSVKSGDPDHITKTITTTVTKPSQTITGNLVPLMRDTPVKGKKKKHEKLKGIEPDSIQAVEPLTDCENQEVTFTLEEGPDYIVKTVTTTIKKPQIVTGDVVPLMTAAPVNVNVDVQKEKKKIPEKSVGIEPTSFLSVKPLINSENQEVNIAEVKSDEPSCIMKTVTATLIKSPIMENDSVSTITDSPLFLGKDIDTKKKKKPEKSKSTKLIYAQPLPPQIDHKNMKVIDTSVECGEPGHIKRIMTSTTNSSQLVGSDSFAKITCESKFVESSHLAESCVDFEEVVVPKDQLLDNSVLKSKRDLKKRKIRRDADHSPIIDSQVGHSAVVQSRLLVSENKSSDGITPDSVIMEAQRSGIFGSVMDKHYWMPENEQDAQKLSSGSLKTKLENIFSGDEKFGKKSKSKNAHPDMKVQKPSHSLGSNSPDFSENDICSIKRLAAQMFPWDAEIQSNASEQVTQSLPHYFVKPSGEVTRELTDEFKTSDPVCGPSLTDEQKLKLWFIQNRDAKSYNSTSNPPFEVSEMSDHPTIWFATDDKGGKESGFERQIPSNFSELKKAEDEWSSDLNKFVKYKSSTLKGALNDGNLHSTGGGTKSSTDEFLKKKVRKSVSDVAESIDNVKIQLENPSDFEIILKMLDDKESVIHRVRNELQEEADIEEYQLLLTEIDGVLTNIAALRTFVLSQCDQNQAKLLALNKRQSDLFKCSEIISFTSNWLTTTELKLASDDDTYLDDAVNENNIYKVLSKEANSNQRKLQESIQLCQLYIGTGDNDNTVKDLLGTLTHLQKEVRQISQSLAERLEALQTKPITVPDTMKPVRESPEPTPETSEPAPEVSKLVPKVAPVDFCSNASVSVAVTALPLRETSFTQTSPNIFSEKEVQTSIADESVSFEHAEAQTSLNQDSSHVNDTECSEDLSAHTSEDSLGSVYVPKKNKKHVEISEIDSTLGDPESEEFYLLSTASAPATETSSSEFGVVDEPENKIETESTQSIKKSSKKTKRRKQIANVSHSIVYTSQAVVEGISQKKHIPQVTEAAKLGKTEVDENQSSKKTERETTPKHESEVIFKIDEGITSAEITSPQIMKGLTEKTERKLEPSDLILRDDFEFCTPEDRDLICATTLSPVEVFTQEMAPAPKLNQEKMPDSYDSSEMKRNDESSETSVIFSSVEKILQTSSEKPSRIDEKKVTSSDPRISAEQHVIQPDSKKESLDEVFSKKVYPSFNAEAVSSLTQYFQETSSEKPSRIDEKKVTSSDPRISAEHHVIQPDSKKELLDEVFLEKVYPSSNAEAVSTLTQYFQETASEKPSRIDEKKVLSSGPRISAEQHVIPPDSKKESLDEVFSKKVSPLETVSTSTQCFQETVSQGVQSSMEPFPETAGKTDQATSTRRVSPKKVKKRSDTMYVSGPPMEPPIVSLESPTAPVVEEDFIKGERQIVSFEKSSPSDEWENVTHRLLLRIRNADPMGYSSLYLKDHPPSLMNTADAVNNFYIIITKIQTYLKGRDKNNLRISIAKGAEDLSNLLDDLNYQIFALKQSSHRLPLEDQISILNDIKLIKTDLDNKCITPLSHVIEDSCPLLTADELVPCQELIKMLKEQSENVDKAYDSVNVDSKAAYEEWCYFLNEVRIIKEVLINMKADLENVTSGTDLSFEDQLAALDKLEKLNNEYTSKLYALMTRIEKVILHSPCYKIPDEVFALFSDLKNMEYIILTKRNEVLQTASEIQDYENMLKLLTKIMDAAASNLLVFPVVVSSLPQLQDEMQKYRTFFVHLNHWKSLLESVQENLDKKTRAKYHDLHSQVITRASEILDRGCYHSQKMALAASKWTIIRNGITEENAWLECVENRFPDLSAIHSADHERYSVLYSTLATDIYQKLAKTSQLVDSARRLCKEIACPELEFGYNKYQEDLTSLRDNVNNDICILETFGENWNRYNSERVKLSQWINSIESYIDDFDPVSDMQKFWWLQAKFESNKRLNEHLISYYNDAMKLLKIQDKEEQQQIFDELQKRWQNLTAKMTALQNKATEKFINPHIPVDQKLDSIEKELNELNAEFSNVPDEAHSEDEFQFYCHKAKVMEKAAQRIENELKCYKLLTIPESERVSVLMNQAQAMAFNINEEVHYALSVEDYLKDINRRIELVSKQQLRQNSVLNQCETCLGERQEDIDLALEKCEDLTVELQAQWHEITKLCQLFHTFPKGLKINVTLPTLEQQLVHIKNNQENLENRCKILLDSLKERSALWKRFTDLKREVLECSELIEFRTDLLSINGTIDYRRLAAISENLQDLSASFDSRESDLLGDLKASAECLKLVSNEEVQNEIDTQVEESVVAWSDSRKSLSSLCERYENAVKIWANYRRNSDIVNEWVDDQLHSLSNLPPEEALTQVQVYSRALDEQSSKLSELRAMVMEIVNEVGFKEENPLTDEITLLSKKLEDVKSAITIISGSIENQKCADFIGAIEETEKCISSIKDDLHCNGDKKSSQDHVEYVQKLQSQLHSLSLTDATINNMKQEQAELLTDPENSVHRQKISVTKILELSQQVFKEAFQQYHRFFVTVASNQDSLEALKLWKDYLESIQDFLRTEIPDSYDNLSSELNICHLHESLLIYQNTVLLNEKSKRTSPHLSEQMDTLENLHNSTLSSIKSRLDGIKRRLDRWETYRNEQNKLLSWLRSVESEQSRLNIRYVYLSSIENKLNKIQDLLRRVSEGTILANVLQEQHKQLLEGCGPGLRSSVRAELDAVSKRIQNLEAALKTWYEFLIKIRTHSKLYDEEVNKIEEMFQTIHLGIEKEICPDQETFNIKNLRNKIELVKNYEEVLLSLDKELKILSEFEDQLMEVVDIKDAKKIRQKRWLLTQQQSDLKYQLSTYKLQFEEKLALWMLFDVRHTAFITWSKKLKERLQQFSMIVSQPDVILRRMELEFCAEIDSKQYEYDWLLQSGSCLQQKTSESVSVEDEQNLTVKIDEIRSIWAELNANTKGRVEKVKSLINEMKILEQSYRELILWIRKKRSDLNKTVYFRAFEDSALQEKLKEHEVIEQKIQLKSAEVTDVIKRGNAFLSDCEDYNISFDLTSFVLSQNSVEESWRSLQMECAKAKENILTIWKLIQEVLSLCSTKAPWLNEQEKKLKTIEKRYKTIPLSLLQPLVGEIESVSSGINNHSTQFKLLEETYADLLAKNAVHDLAVVQETLSRFGNFKFSCNRLLKLLDADLSRWRDYESAHSNLVLRLSQFDAKLTKLQHLDESNENEPEDVYEEKLKKLMVLELELEPFKNSIQNAEVLKSDLSSKKKRTDSDAKGIQKMADEYLNIYKDIKKRMKTLKQFYRKQAPSRSNVNSEAQVETMKFEQDFSAQVDTLPTSLQRKDAFLYELQNTMKETRDNIERLTELLVSNNMEEISKVTATCQSSVDLMKHLSAVLESQCEMSPNDPALSSVKELDDSFEQLLLKIRFQQQQQQRQQAEANSEIGRLRCPLCSERNWSQLNNDIWRLEKWLEHADATLQAHPSTPPENIEQLEDVIQEHKEFMMYLDSHHDLIVSLNIVGKHLMDHSQNEEQSSQLQERMAKVNEKWETISTQSLVWLTKLQSALMENNEFHAVIAELLEWIEKTENSIKICEPVDLLEERTVIEEKYRKFGKLHRELKRCEPRVASLQAANQVCASQQIQKLENSQTKLDHLRLRLQSLIRVTWLYMLKLGGVLGHDMTDMYASSLSIATPMTLSQEFLDENTIEPLSDRPDSPDSTSSNGNDENQSVLSRGHRFFGRVIRASLPIQAFIFVMLGVASLFPRVEEEYTCATSNSMWSLEPVLRYPDGPPPT